MEFNQMGNHFAQQVSQKLGLTSSPYNNSRLDTAGYIHSPYQVNALQMSFLAPSALNYSVNHGVLQDQNSYSVNSPSNALLPGRNTSESLYGDSINISKDRFRRSEFKGGYHSEKEGKCFKFHWYLSYIRVTLIINCSRFHKKKIFYPVFRELSVQKDTFKTLNIFFGTVCR